MPRFSRWLLNAVTVLSLLLTVATAALWVRSYWVDDVIEVKIADPAHRRVEKPYVRSDGGLVLLERGFVQFDRPGDVPNLPGIHRAVRHYKTTPHRNTFLMAQGSFWHRRGFVADGFGMPWHGFLLLPYWFVVSVLSSPAWFAAFRRLQRFRQFRRRVACADCLACGYSLVANLSGVCPECGTEIAKATAFTPAAAR